MNKPKTFNSDTKLTEPLVLVNYKFGGERKIAQDDSDKGCTNTDRKGMENNDSLEKKEVQIVTCWDWNTCGICNHVYSEQVFIEYQPCTRL